jgi:hypothetical protein
MGRHHVVVRGRRDLSSMQPGGDQPHALARPSKTPFEFASKLELPRVEVKGLEPSTYGLQSRCSSS